MGGVCLHLVEALFLSSLSLCPFGVEVSVDLNPRVFSEIFTFSHAGRASSLRVNSSSRAKSCSCSSSTTTAAVVVEVGEGGGGRGQHIANTDDQ
jgi:hypothetical protein